MSGMTMFGNTWETEPTFRDSPFQLDFLTQPTPLLELGIDTGANVCTRVQPTDEVFIAAYPSFNVNGVHPVPRRCDEMRMCRGCGL
jgi:hypothetical protein